LGQIFQIGSLPLLNSLLYRNSPRELTADRLFLALVNSAYGPADLGWLSQSFSSLIWDATPGLDWLDGPNQLAAAGTGAGSNIRIPVQQATDQKGASDIAFANLPNEHDDFGDLGDH
jgi:hypothetical protein